MLPNHEHTYHLRKWAHKESNTSRLKKTQTQCIPLKAVVNIMCSSRTFMKAQELNMLKIRFRFKYYKSKSRRNSRMEKQNNQNTTRDALLQDVPDEIQPPPVN
ncbi:hypothetical protein Dimus_036270 [Dionaea muscipula]